MANPLIRDDGRHAITGESLTPEEIARRQDITGMKSPEHLQRWLRETRRDYLVFKTGDFLKAIRFPRDAEALMYLVSRYDEYRSRIPSGRTQTVVEPLTKKTVEIPIMKSEVLEVEELDRAIRNFAAMIYEQKPDWSIENTPL